MRLLANENTPRAVVDVLRGQGHDVVWVAEAFPSVEDEYVLELAVRESRVLLTQDKDFGELAFRRNLPAACGIVLFRVPAIPSLLADLAAKAFRDSDFRGKFVVVEDGVVRERPLPAQRHAR